MVLTMREVYLNGEYMPLAQAKVPVMDRGFLFGDGVYEVIPVYGGRAFRLPEHLDRLDNSLAAIRMENPLPRNEWGSIFEHLASGAERPDQLVYLQVTRGADPTRNHLFPASPRPTVFVMAWDAKPRHPDIAAKGIAAITLDDFRWLRCDIKAIALLSNVLLRQAADDAGVEESILIRDGYAIEGSISNLFSVLGGELVTPPKGNLLLPGITRDLVVELAREAGIPCIEREITRDQLAGAEEVWITSSSREVAPVTRLDGEPVGAGRPGPLWRRMDGLFQDYKARLRAGHA
jgi:D-alanine transaminase